MDVVSISKKDILIIFYFVTFFIRFFTDISFALTTLLWCMSGIAIILYVYMTEVKLRPIIWGMLGIDAVALVCAMINGNSSPVLILVLVTAQGLGIMMFVSKEDFKMMDTMAIALIVYIFIKVIWVRMNSSSSFFYLSKLVGQNTVSIILIMLLCIDLIYRQREKKRVNYVVIMIALLAAFVCGGNGGILTIALFLVAVWLCDQNGMKINWIKVVLLLISGICVIAALGIFDKLLAFLLDDNSRFAIWGIYFNIVKESFVNLLCGAPISESITLMKFQNMHNTYINWHYYYGIIPSLVFTGIIFVSAFDNLIKKNWYILIVLVITFIRGFTDATDFALLSIWTYTLCLAIYEKDINEENVLIRRIIW